MCRHPILASLLLHPLVRLGCVSGRHISRHALPAWQSRIATLRDCPGRLLIHLQSVHYIGKQLKLAAWGVLCVPWRQDAPVLGRIVQDRFPRDSTVVFSPSVPAAFRTQWRVWCDSLNMQVV